MKERKEFMKSRAWQKKKTAQFNHIKKRNINNVEFLSLSLIPKNLIIFLHYYIIIF